MNPKQILVIDDDQAVLQSCRNILTDEGHEVAITPDGASALELLKQTPFDVALIDLKMPGLGGLEVLAAARQLDPHLVAIIFTAYGTIETAVEAIKLGAFNYIAKPFKAADLIAAVDKAIQHSATIRPSSESLTEPAGRFNDRNFVGQSRAMLELHRTLAKVAASDANVLITGESGTGKEVAAHWIHGHSKRAARPFIAVDCAAIPEHLLESELFGYEKGAFTGADRTKRGLLEQAEGGTLLLDEIGEMAPVLQARLLRVLQERAFRRLGGEKLMSVDIRVLSSTNRDLDEAVGQGRFRSDLLFRINVVHVHMPPLRERDIDIPLLCCHFVHAHARKLGRDPVMLSPEALEILESYRWPGNVRELQNVIERAIVLNENGIVSPANLPAYVVSASEPAAPGDYKTARARWVEGQGKRYFGELLHRHKGNISAASREAHISRKCFYQLMKKFGLEPKPISE